MKKIEQIISLLTCALLMLAVAINRDGRVFGYDVVSEEPGENMSAIYEKDGYIVVSTKEIGKGIVGYGGPVPLDIYIEDGKIAKVVPGKNSESPRYFNTLAESGFIDSWNGFSLADALNLTPDAVSGATFSSTAVSSGVACGISYYLDNPVSVSKASDQLTEPKQIAAVIVVLSAAIIPLFYKNRKYRIVQQVLNIAVLGFWTGSFISLSLITPYLSNGMNIAVSIVPVLLLAVAFIMPLFGKKNHYCNWVCPMGSMQELAGQIIPFKLKISQRTAKYLNVFREILWFAIMFVMWTGTGFAVMDYEPFTAFMFKQAAPAVLAICIAFVLLSFVVVRPYCRFVCPTGTLMKMSEKNN